MNNRRLLICSSWISLCTSQWKKTVKNITSWHKTLSASAVKVDNFQNQSIKIGRRAWPTRDHGKKSSSRLYFKKLAELSRPRSVWNQNPTSAGPTQHMWYETLEKINLSLRSFETGNLSADNFKRILDFDGSTHEPAVQSGDMGERIPCFDSCQLITTLMCNKFSLGLPN